MHAPWSSAAGNAALKLNDVFIKTTLITSTLLLRTTHSSKHFYHYSNFSFPGSSLSLGECAACVAMGNVGAKLDFSRILEPLR